VTARALLWELVKHVLHRRGKDEVYLHVELAAGRLATGEVLTFSWAGNDDAFCIIGASGQVEHVWEEL
jgi:hypothetical protein